MPNIQEEKKGMEKAIKLAIEGGWKPKQNTMVVIPVDREPLRSVDSIFLDPLFWQCLGKSLGWEELEGNDIYPVYRDKWHQFIDHLVEGKDVDEFFDKLIKETRLMKDENWATKDEKDIKSFIKQELEKVYRQGGEDGISGMIVTYDARLIRGLERQREEIREDITKIFDKAIIDDYFLEKEDILSLPSLNDEKE